jgi:hypothetical protein
MGFFSTNKTSCVGQLGYGKLNDVSNFDLYTCLLVVANKEFNNEVTTNKVDTIDPLTF